MFYDLAKLYFLSLYAILSKNEATIRASVMHATQFPCIPNVCPTLRTNLKTNTFPQMPCKYYDVCYILEHWERLQLRQMEIHRLMVFWFTPSPDPNE